MSKLKGTTKRKEVTAHGGSLFVDKRRFYTFRTIAGQLVETKSVTREEALNHIKVNLGIQLEEAA